MPTRYVAHRGGAAQWPENSLSAFRNALALGARILELDVHLTADGAVAVIHDPTLERTSSGTGPVAASTTADLKRARLRGPDGVLTDDWVPTLDEVLALAGPAGAALLVEVKTPGPAVRYERQGERVTAVPGPRYEGLERKVLDLLRSAGVSDRTFIMAFNPAVLAEVRALAPEQPTTLLVDRRHVEQSGARPVETVAWAREARASFLGVHYSLCDAAVVEAAHRAKISVGVFTVNDEPTMRRLAALGVDVIISDRADLVTRLQAEA
ncbi:MAG TPA: glycerophosphodiester phosphodiesterase family protein [Candidatus Acidoferrum sp.]|jgi:glycerophosphoryl diester phosphodiesterase|nr:glycerophosphodiester phosphodiesterase family protein [Candidatus Acidoferrum sp.]